MKKQAGTLFILSIIGIAMGWWEAMIVVYIRQIVPMNEAFLIDVDDYLRGITGPFSLKILPF